ncbi:hypothetical protein SCHPADRAFT_24760 [Schizopora paradoxa]|uniref:Uncharacterized protein n=1 Tax=Schizopora paradoxa TaxID=27342 RepID=A0A0H2S7U0_9AGAM|nr:hypothetical protein SCHPADRAFT_24760 [Schizopora paradoxa]
MKVGAKGANESKYSFDVPRLAPYVPIPDRELDMKRTSVLSNNQCSNFLDLKNSPLVDSDNTSFEGFCYFRDIAPQEVIKKRSSQRPLSSIMRRRTSKLSTRAPEENIDAFQTSTPLSPRSSEVKSILRSPTRHFPGDSLSVADFPSIRRSMSRASLGSTPRKLQKKRSTMTGTTPRLSVLANRKSMSSLLGIAGSDVKDDSPCVDPMGPSVRRLDSSASVSSATPNLPAGIVQTGRGIGYSHTPQASRSKISLVSIKSNSCFGKIKFPNINMLACKSADNLPRTRKDVMQQIYGSNWSIAHSTINFGIPEGLGQRVDEDEVPPLPVK